MSKSWNFQVFHTGGHPERDRATLHVTEYFARSLVAGPVVWNSLPAHLRDPAPSSDSFKTALKTHLFTESQ